MRLRSLVTGLFAAAAAIASMALPATASAAPGGGMVSPDIVGGSPAPAYSFMASMQSLSGSHRCGASVVHANWAVTARHCISGISPGSLQLRVGSNNRTSGGVVVGVTGLYSHPSADLAMMRIGTVPAAYPPIRIAATSGPVGTATRIMGWGQTCPTPGGCGAPIQLQQLNTSIVNDFSCSGINAASEICTSNPGGTAGACYGDSGGPEIKSVSGAWELIGATSRSGGGSTCAVAPSIYVDVPYFRSWIQGITGLPL
ncbi:MAG TPA: serine protease [Pseudonocardiaceae bacterium]